VKVLEEMQGFMSTLCGIYGRDRETRFSEFKLAGGEIGYCYPGGSSDGGFSFLPCECAGVPFYFFLVVSPCLFEQVVCEWLQTSL
jgi:hypothetical protein